MEEERQYLMHESLSSPLIFHRLSPSILSYSDTLSVSFSPPPRSPFSFLISTLSPCVLSLFSFPHSLSRSVSLLVSLSLSLSLSDLSLSLLVFLISLSVSVSLGLSPIIRRKCHVSCQTKKPARQLCEQTTSWVCRLIGPCPILSNKTPNTRVEGIGNVNRVNQRLAHKEIQISSVIQ